MSHESPSSESNSIPNESAQIEPGSGDMDSTGSGEQGSNENDGEGEDPEKKHVEQALESMNDKMTKEA